MNELARAIEYSADTQIISSFFGFIAVVFFILVFMGLIMFCMNAVFPRSQRYRREISDLYITAKIKQIADKEGVDIDSELKFLSKLGSKDKTFDKVLEERINEKLLEDLEEKKEKKTK